MKMVYVNITNNMIKSKYINQMDKLIIIIVKQKYNKMIIIRN